MNRKIIGFALLLVATTLGACGGTPEEGAQESPPIESAPVTTPVEAPAPETAPEAAPAEPATAPAEGAGTTESTTPATGN